MMFLRKSGSAPAGLVRLTKSNTLPSRAPYLAMRSTLPERSAESDFCLTKLEIYDIQFPLTESARPAGRRDEESLFENCPNYNLSANRKGKANFFISLARNPLKSPGSGK